MGVANRFPLNKFRAVKQPGRIRAANKAELNSVAGNFLNLDLARIPTELQPPNHLRAGVATGGRFARSRGQVGPAVVQILQGFLL